MEIKNYEDYLIYECGLLFSERKNIYLTPIIENGYERVKLYNKDNVIKNFYIHRLVALHYVPKIEGKDFVDHIDGNKLNNHYTNLRWTTHIENMNNFRSINSNNKLGHKNISYHKTKKVYIFDKLIYGKKYEKYFKTLIDALCYKFIFILKRKAGLLK